MTEELSDLLAETIADAAEGKITSLFIVSIDADGRPNYSWDGIDNKITILGAVHACLKDFTQEEIYFD